MVKRLGMEREEVARLNNRAGMPQQVKTTSFNQAWVPKHADSP
jgi:predicted DNA-binding transcriptional regulator AlpA